MAGLFKSRGQGPVPTVPFPHAERPRQPANLGQWVAGNLAAGSQISDGFELMFQGTPSRNARHTGFEDGAYPAREYGR
jgi:hypothetical protein